MKHSIINVMYILASILHTDTHGMLKKQFSALKSLTQTTTTYQSKTPPSPISPMSPCSYPPPTNLLTQQSKLSNSNISTRPATTKKDFLSAMLEYYKSATLKKKAALSPIEELNVYHSCLQILTTCSQKISAKQMLEYIRSQNVKLTTQSKKPLPRVIAWAALDTYLSEKEFSLEKVFYNENNVLEKLEKAVGIYRFPARYINNQSNKIRPKKNSSFDALFLSPNEKIFTKTGEDLFLHSVLLPGSEQQLTIKTTKHNTVKIGNSVVFEATGKYAVIFAPKGPVTLWDITGGGTCIATLYDDPKDKRTIKNVLVSNGCERVCTLFSDGSYLLQAVKNGDVKKSTSTRVITEGSSLHQAALSPDGKLLAIDTTGNTLWVNDYSQDCKPDNKNIFPLCTKDTAIYSYVHPDKKISQVAFDPLSQYIAIVTEVFSESSEQQKYHLMFCDLTKGTNNQPILDWQLPESVDLMAFSHRGKYLALAYTNGFINVCPVGKKDASPLQLDLSFGQITHLTFDKDEISLFVSTKNGSVVIIDVRSGEITAVLKHKQLVINGYFTDRWPLHGLLTATSNKTIHRWGSQTTNVSLPTYLLLRYLPTHQVIPVDMPPAENIWLANKNYQEKINTELKQLECSLTSVITTKTEPETANNDSNTIELLTQKNPKQLIWLSDNESRFFLGTDGQFPTGVFSIPVYKNWFNADGKSI